MANGSNDTYAGALEVLAKQVSTMMGLADANLPFCTSLLEQITAERRSPETQMQQAGLLPQGPPAGAGLPPGIMPMPGGASAPPPSFAGAGVPGAGPQTSSPPANPDELRRILTAGG